MQSDTSELQQQQVFQSDVNNVSAQNLQSAVIAADEFRFLEYIQHNLFGGALDKTALFYAGEAISYPQVGQNVARIMHALRQKDLQAGAVVAVCLPKSAQHVYAVLACALLGIIWLPVDMDAPEARRDYLLSNSKVDVLIAQARVDGRQCVLIDEVLAAPLPQQPECCYRLDRSAAYYLYTSGSTGTPKCVVLNNLATANVLGQTIGRWHVQQDDVLMAVTPFHHDMSVFDVFAAMALGASLVIPTPAQVKDACAWAQLVATYGITLWVSVPAIVDMLCSVARVEQLQSLRLVAQGGDYIKPGLIQYLRAHLPQARLFSLGGPTETTIWSIWHEITAADVDVIPYGRALPHNQYYILDEQLQPCALGEVGQMYMAGVNLSNGYLLDGQLLTGDFVSLQCDAGKTALRMSDLGYVRADGNIIFAGRTEGYLKIKGVRISAAEVEAVLAKSGCLQDCVVVCCTHPVTSMHELVAVYTLPQGEQQVDIGALKESLMASLPKSHIPTRWLAIEEIPLTRNVKVDRKLVQQMAQERLYQAAAAAGQNQAVADDVVAIFRDCRPQQADDAGDIFVHTEILTIGMRLKQLMRVAKRIAEQFDVQLDAPALVRCKTVQDVVQQVQQKMLN
ncbi:AMP-binding protein [Snodgrassella sp. ESL0253]|uniref:AMP-binding protein n=1 Tax=Snodgrassella sp. ESL0253 TaxID=2705031 RepID=UPI0015841880|nr:AMP-binding protein [Snodgrassella sp. ESL0253]NUE66322.1 AMP-binding protein [Snodgrassella sp. ESL0253]